MDLPDHMQNEAPFLGNVSIPVGLGVLFLGFLCGAGSPDKYHLEMWAEHKSSYSGCCLLQTTHGLACVAFRAFNSVAFFVKQKRNPTFHRLGSR